MPQDLVYVLYVNGERRETRRDHFNACFLARGHKDDNPAAAVFVAILTAEEAENDPTGSLHQLPATKVGTECPVCGAPVTWTDHLPSEHPGGPVRCYVKARVLDAEYAAQDRRDKQAASDREDEREPVEEDEAA